MRLAARLLLTSLCGLVGCQRDNVAANATGQPSSTPDATAAPTSSAPPHDEPKIPLPGPARKRLASAVTENVLCETCHDEIAKEWRGSYHQRANIEPAYQKAFAIEPSPFCRSCHAPEADPLEEPPEAVSTLGVGCVTCHVTEQGIVLAAAHPNDHADPERPAAPHPLRRSREFAQAGGCAGCHEFRFPTPGGNDDAFFMQTTAREHLRSPAAAKPCADCHMPLRQGRRSHAFAEVRDATWLRANLEVTAERSADDTLRITLVQPKPGHDFPTGDLFRRLELGYELRDDQGKTLHRETRYLARHFQIVPGISGRHLAHDNRVESKPKIVELDVPPPAKAKTAARLSWWVTYQRVATVGQGTNPADAIIESEVKLHSGMLSWNDNPPSLDAP